VVRADGTLAASEGTCLAVEDETTSTESSRGRGPERQREDGGQCPPYEVTQRVGRGLPAACSDQTSNHEPLRQAARSATHISTAGAKWPGSGATTVRGGSADLFIEHLQPPQAIVIFGAGPDAVPVVNIAKTLGWHVTVVGTRPASAMPQLFPTADALRVTSSD